MQIQISDSGHVGRFLLKFKVNCASIRSLQLLTVFMDNKSHKEKKKQKSQKKERKAFGLNRN